MAPQGIEIARLDHLGIVGGVFRVELTRCGGQLSAWG
jgi:hypothetical protein